MSETNTNTAVTEKAPETKAPAAKAAAKTAAKKPASRMMKVIIQRPPGRRDSHMFVGLNKFEKQVAFDKEIMLPEAVVNHLRKQVRTEFAADENGNPKAFKSNAFNIVDVK